MGMSSIETISSKVGDPTFKDNLSAQYNKYQETLNKVNELKNNINLKYKKQINETIKS